MSPECDRRGGSVVYFPMVASGPHLAAPPGRLSMRVTAESVRPCLRAIVLASVALVAGCGDGASLQSPAGPSTLADTQLQPGDATERVVLAATGESSVVDKGDKGDKGEKEARGKGGEKKPENDGNDDDGRGRSHQDKVVGFVSAKNGDTLTVEGISIVAGSHAIIRHGHRTLTMGDIEVGNHVHARGAMDGSKLVAVEIKVQDTRGRNGENDDDDADEDGLEGNISNLSSSSNCPSVTFNIGSTRITTSSSTSYDEVTCGNLANGMKVEVRGTKQGDGSIAAARIERK